jgi:phosphoenolpyruvate-protein kinase (PTS system EI component)
MGLGVDELSVACFDLPRVKAAIRGVTLVASRGLAEEALAQSTAEDVRAVMLRHAQALAPPAGGRREGST